MLNKPAQEEIFQKLIGLPSIIGEYFKTLFSVLVHPIATFDKVLTKNIGSTQLGPAVFFVTNILTVHLIDHLFGYDIPKFPFETTLIQNPFGNFPFIVLRYLFGTFLFLFIFKLLMKEYRFSILIKQVFPIVCYASAIYIPYAFFHGLVGMKIGEYILDSSTDILNNAGQLAYIEYQLKILAFFIIPQIAFIAWWLWVVYLGLKSIRLSTSKNIKKAIAITPIIFVMVQISTVLIASYILNSSTIRALEIVYTGKIYKILDQDNTNYINAMFLADEVSSNKQIPEYGRYAYKLIKVASSISIPTFHNEKTVVSEIKRNIKNHDFDNVEYIITKHIDSLRSNVDLKRELSEIVALRNSPTFVNLNGKTVTLHFKLVDDLGTAFPDLIRVNETNYIFDCPVVVSSALFSIFP